MIFPDSSFTSVLKKFRPNSELLESSSNTIDDHMMDNNDTIDPIITDPVRTSNANNTVTLTPTQHQNEPLPKRTTQLHTIPKYLNEYTYTLPSLQPTSTPDIISHSNINHSISLTSFSPKSQQLMKYISHDIEPSSDEEAFLDPLW